MFFFQEKSSSANLCGALRDNNHMSVKLENQYGVQVGGHFPSGFI